MTINQLVALVFLVMVVVFLVAWVDNDIQVRREAARWNNATTPEEIAALLPPGHRYDSATGLCHPPEAGALPYRRGQRLVRG